MSTTEVHKEQQAARSSRAGRGGDRLSQTALQEHAHRMPKRSFDRLIEKGLLNPPGEDGRWDPSELERLDAVMALGEHARDLNRRVLLLPLEGWFPVTPECRQRAVVELLSSGLRPAARKMREVRRELDILHRRTMSAMGWPLPRKPRSYRLRLPRERWPDVVAAVDIDTFQREYHLASWYAQILPSILQADRVRPKVDVPTEERIALILVNVLLGHDEARVAVGLPRLPMRRGLDIQQ